MNEFTLKCMVFTWQTGRKVQIMRQGEKQWMMKIVNAIQAGDTVILENIGETLDASLDSVLTMVCIDNNKKG